jgi:hypothetical protein
MGNFLHFSLFESAVATNQLCGQPWPCGKPLRVNERQAGSNCIRECECDDCEGPTPKSRNKSHCSVRGIVGEHIHKRSQIPYVVVHVVLACHEGRIASFL